MDASQWVGETCPLITDMKRPDSSEEGTRGQVPLAFSSKNRSADRRSPGGRITKKMQKTKEPAEVALRSVGVATPRHIAYFQWILRFEQSLSRGIDYRPISEPLLVVETLLKNVKV